MRHAFWCLLCFTAPAQTLLQRAIAEGYSLTPEQAAVLEQQVAANPSAMDVRAKLIGYYFTRVQTLRQDAPDSVRQERGRHIRWFVENDPASEVLAASDAFAMSGWMNDPAIIRRSATCGWLKQRVRRSGWEY